MTADAVAAAVVAGGYATLLYLRRLNTVAVPRTALPPDTDWITDREHCTIYISDDLTDAEAATEIQDALRALLGGRTVVEHPDGTIGLSSGVAVGHDGSPPMVTDAPQGRPKLRLV